MIKLKPIFLIILTGVLLNSCTYIYYPNYPVIAEVEDETYGAQVTVGLSKAQLSGWYAFDSSIFATATLSGALSWLEERSNDPNNANRPYKTFTATAGVGYQYKFGKQGITQILGGGGISQGHLLTSLFNSADAGNVLEAIDIDYQSTRIYLQPSIGASDKNGSFYFIPRLTMENFTNLKPTGSSVNPSLVKRNFIFLEPILFKRYLSKEINIDLYTGVSFTISNDRLTVGDEIIVTQPIMFGLGVSRNF